MIIVTRETESESGVSLNSSIGKYIYIVIKIGEIKRKRKEHITVGMLDMEH